MLDTVYQQGKTWLFLTTMMLVSSLIVHLTRTTNRSSKPLSLRCMIVDLLLDQAKEVDNASTVRITLITELIGQCRRGIHDLCRTDLDEESQLPRFNMPLELGIFLGTNWLGTQKQKRKFTNSSLSLCHHYCPKPWKLSNLFASK